jgi:hypothetical protein
MERIPSDPQAERYKTAWSDAIDGLRCRWVRSAESIVAGTAPTITVEVENVSSEEILWNCESGMTLGISVKGVSPANTMTMPKFRVRVGKGASPAYPSGAPTLGKDPDYFRLEQGGRLKIVCALPWVLPGPGRYEVSAIVGRRMSKKWGPRIDKIVCPALTLNAVAETNEPPKVYWGAADLLYGLQLGFTFDSQDKAYRKGEKPNFALLIRNTGGKTVSVVDYVGDGLRGWAPDIVDSAGKRMLVNVPPFNMPVRQRVISLGPGEIKTIGIIWLSLGPDSRMPSARLEAGTYRISQTYRFAENPKATWYGELTTGRLPLRIVNSDKAGGSTTRRDEPKRRENPKRVEHATNEVVQGADSEYIRQTEIQAKAISAECPLEFGTDVPIEIESLDLPPDISLKPLSVRFDSVGEHITGFLSLTGLNRSRRHKCYAIVTMLLRNGGGYCRREVAVPTRTEADAEPTRLLVLSEELELWNVDRVGVTIRAMHLSDWPGIIEGKFALKEELPLKIKATTREGKEVLRCNSIRFAKIPEIGELYGLLKIDRRKAVDSRWRLRVEVHGAEGQLLGHAKRVYLTTNSPGASAIFPLGSRTIADKAKTFRLSLQRAPDDAITSVEAAFEPDTERLVRLSADAERVSYLAQIRRVRFNLLANGSLEATLHVYGLQVAETKWQIGLELLDDVGRRVRHMRTTFATAAKEVYRPHSSITNRYEGEEIELLLGQWDEISNTSRFRLSLKPASSGSE